jgi:hypothetical protein
VDVRQESFFGKEASSSTKPRRVRLWCSIFKCVRKSCKIAMNRI